MKPSNVVTVAMGLYLLSISYENMIMNAAIASAPIKPNGVKSDAVLDFQFLVLICHGNIIAFMRSIIGNSQACASAWQQTKDDIAMTRVSSRDIGRASWRVMQFGVRS